MSYYTPERESGIIRQKKRVGTHSGWITVFLLMTGTLFAQNDEQNQEKIMNRAEFTVSAAAPGKTMGNKVSNVNIFSLQGVPEKFVYCSEYDAGKFIEYVQIMQATGGSESRDLFREPLNRDVLDDYKFDELLAKCHAILKLGAKPHVKTGNVPLKFSKDAKLGFFNVNLYPPDDYRVYYKYIHAIGTALVREFGLSEVKTWRFGVLTEYENASWFTAVDGDPESTFREYCKLYDCTVAALQDSISPEICVGAHSMSVSEGLWDECRFIRRCGPGADNTWTGKKGVKVDFLNASFYDERQGKYTQGKTLAQTIGDLRAAAESVGLKHLFFGVDEGRILDGVPGKVKPDLVLRMTGDTWQAGYDARQFKTCFDHDIAYFSAWGFFSTGLCCPPGGLPTVSYYVADGVSKFAGMKRLKAEKKGRTEKGVEIECTAALSKKKDRVYLMLYQFKNDPSYRRSASVTLNLNDLPFDGEARVTLYPVDDTCNFFPQWRKDRAAHGIGDDCFCWSPDDPALDSPMTLADPTARKLYLKKLKPQYAELAKMKPLRRTERITGGTLTLPLKIAPNGVVFVEIVKP